MTVLFNRDGGPSQLRLLRPQKKLALEENPKEARSERQDLRPAPNYWALSPSPTLSTTSAPIVRHLWPTKLPERLRVGPTSDGSTQELFARMESVRGEMLFITGAR
jgi:hypothetical protein